MKNIYKIIALCGLLVVPSAELLCAKPTNNKKTSSLHEFMNHSLVGYLWPMEKKLLKVGLVCGVATSIVSYAKNKNLKRSLAYGAVVTPMPVLIAVGLIVSIGIFNNSSFGKRFYRFMSR